MIDTTRVFIFNVQNFRWEFQTPCATIFTLKEIKVFWQTFWSFLPCTMNGVILHSLLILKAPVPIYCNWKKKKVKVWNNMRVKNDDKRIYLWAVPLVQDVSADSNTFLFCCLSCFWKVRMTLPCKFTEGRTFFCHQLNLAMMSDLAMTALSGEVIHHPISNHLNFLLDE